MATRIPASQRTREELTALIEGRLSTGSAKDELVKLATRLRYGRGVAKDMAKAVAWYRRALAAGHDEVSATLEHVLRRHPELR